MIEYPAADWIFIGALYIFGAWYYLRGPYMAGKYGDFETYHAGSVAPVWWLWKLGRRAGERQDERADRREEKRDAKRQARVHQRLGR